MRIGVGGPTTVFWALFLWGLALGCVRISRDNPLDPLSPRTSKAGTTLVLIDDCEDQDRITKQGPDHFWEVRSDRQILLQGDSSVLPTDETMPYMAAVGMNSNFAFRATGTLRHELFPGENPASPFYGFVRITIDLWADPKKHKEINYAFKSDPTPGFSPRFIVGVQAKDGDFFSWTEVLPSAGMPVWQVQALDFDDAVGDAINFHRVLGSAASARWPGSEISDLVRIYLTLYSEGPTQFSFGPTAADFFPFAIYVDDIQLK